MSSEFVPPSQSDPAKLARAIIKLRRERFPEIKPEINQGGAEIAQPEDVEVSASMEVKPVGDSKLSDDSMSVYDSEKEKTEVLAQEARDRIEAFHTRA